MSRPVFSFRPNPENPEHRKAWEILKNVPDGKKGSFLVRAILQADRESRLEELFRSAVREELMGPRLEGLLRRTVREELGGSQPEGLPRKTVRNEPKGSHMEGTTVFQDPKDREPEIPGQMLDFLSRLG